MHENDSIEPWWLTLADIVGFEKDDDSDDSDDSGDDDTGEDDEDSDDSDDSEDDSGDEDDEDEEDSDKKYSEKDVRNLRKALRSERMSRKKFERENKRLKGASKNGDGKQGKDSDKKEDEKEESKGPSEREVRLAATLRDQALDHAITRVASKMNFLDIDDVLRLVNRKEIDVMQDDDDPTEVDVDVEAVEDALKELARKKKYLVGSRSPGSKSGSKMSGKNKGGKGLSDDELRGKYKMPF